MDPLTHLLLLGLIFGAGAVILGLGIYTKPWTAAARSQAKSGGYRNGTGDANTALTVGAVVLIGGGVLALL